MRHWLTKCLPTNNRLSHALCDCIQAILRNKISLNNVIQKIPLYIDGQRYNV